MSDKTLASRHCSPCGLGTPPMSPEEANRQLAGVPRWKITRTEDNILQLRREFHFTDFRQAFALAYKVAALAEREDHHPELHVEWGRTAVVWWTHKVNGLHENDFIMAAKTDRLAELAKST